MTLQLTIRTGNPRPLAHKPKLWKFINSKTRYQVSGFPNFIRFWWWKVDITAEWT